MSNEKKISVVIIDDYDMTRSLIQIVLRSAKFDIVGEATDGRSGVDLCLKLQPDIVLLDVIMPIMNGIEALELIRAKLPNTVIIMITGNDEQDVVDQAMKKGASGFIVKPFNSASVVETMNLVRSKFVLRPAANVK